MGTIALAFDPKNKETGDRESMTELGIYTVEKDKIIREECLTTHNKKNPSKRKGF